MSGTVGTAYAMSMDTTGGTIFASLVIAAFWAVIAGVIIVRLVRARRGSKLRTALAPLAGAAEEYQHLLTGRDGMPASVQIAFAEEPQQLTSQPLPGQGDQRG